MSIGFLNFFIFFKVVKKMAYDKESQKTYHDKCQYFKVKYTPAEFEEAERLKSYLQDTGKSVNSYLKALIKADLDIKGI